jgi:hypothetical protein
VLERSNQVTSHRRHDVAVEVARRA